jgi:hypothetical protein
MNFTIIGTIRDVETIAIGSRIRELKLLTERHGKGRWRKLKGNAAVRLVDGTQLPKSSSTGTKLMESAVGT